ncbi:hypothetical protein KP509_30G033400 [Ceratopteris richardii]|uniref:Poly(A) RNA polymerase mitochondrial-like central palm domain-containing protein n=1 Tax=Ceratopteris richardii TaxID=49495 RepID=A0A8T2R3M7_CERRI|nr:hypothetical protein KP509_30G033400 [Ceratopteris richardii]
MLACELTKFYTVGDVRKHYGICNAQAFGSFTMNMFTSTSDLDISLNVERGSDSLSRQDGISLLKKLTKLLYKFQSSGIVQDIQPVLRAKVPVVKFVLSKTGIECDISVENRDGILKSELLRVFSSIDSRFRKLCFLLKAWANANGINSSKDNTLNSLSLILLAALHLQTRVPAILPPFSMLFKGEDSIRPLHVAFLAERQANAYKNYGKHNNESVVQLFNSFLTKMMAVKDLWQEGLCASAYKGSWVLTSSPSWIYVEDFTDLSQNAARAVNSAGFEAIYECFEQTSIYLRDYFLGLEEAQSLRKLLFDLRIESAVHKRKRNKKAGLIATNTAHIQDLSGNTVLGFKEQRIEQRPVHRSAQIIEQAAEIIERNYLPQVGYPYLGHHTIPVGSLGLLSEHPAKRFKVAHAEYNHGLSTHVGREALPQEFVRVPADVYFQSSSRDRGPLRDYRDTRFLVGEQRFHEPLSTLEMDKQRKMLGIRVPDAEYTGAPYFLPRFSIGTPSINETFRDLPPVGGLNRGLTYGHVSRLYDHF